jgi:hypothetical protein
MTPNIKRLTILVLLPVVVLGGWFIYHNHSLSAKLTLEVAPTGSHININGNAVRGGQLKVKPGSYHLTFSQNGFSDYSKDVQLTKGESSFVGVSLSPNSAATADWYKSHPEDAKKAEGISSKNFDQISLDQQRRLPLIKELPFIDLLWRVDYGRSVQHPNDPGAVAVYVSYYTEAAKKDAQDWLKFKGYDLSKLEIIYEYVGP